MSVDRAQSSSADLRAPTTGARDALAAVTAVAGEALIVAVSFSPDVPVFAVLALHAVVVLAVGSILFYRRNNFDQSVAAIMLAVVACAGPAGAAASLAMLPFVGRAGAGPNVLRSWYARLASAGGVDAATEIHDRVAAGRVIRCDARSPADFRDIIESGTLAERQAALGLMARKFHTDYAPALELALRSPEPVVRVQAAAVVARVRADLKARVKALLNGDRATTAPANIELAVELLRLSNTSLVDRADASRCKSASDDRLRLALATGRDVARASAIATKESASVIERFLVASGRAKDFRVSRRIHDLAAGRRYQVRRLPTRVPA